MDQERHREEERGDGSRLNVTVSEIKTMRSGTAFKIFLIKSIQTAPRLEHRKLQECMQVS